MSSSPKVLGIAGLALLLLGLADVLLVYLRNDASAETVRLVLGAAVLLSLGSGTLAVTGVRRLEERLAKLEAERVTRE